MTHKSSDMHVKLGQVELLFDAGLENVAYFKTSTINFY